MIRLASLAAAAPVFGAGGAAAVSLAGRAYILRSARGRVVTEPDLVEAEVAVVLGSGLRPDGTPTNLLMGRVRGGVELYRRGIVERVVMSGARNPGGDQPGAMAIAAEQLGVPTSAIDIDRAGVDTAATCRGMRHRHPGRRVVAVTQEFHAARTAYLAAKAGLDSMVLATPDAEVKAAPLRQARLREIPASIKAIALDRF